jgi:hypothetical protein
MQPLLAQLVEQDAVPFPNPMGAPKP